MFNYFLTTTGTTSTNIWMTLGIFVVVIAAFYFISIRPQKKRDQELADMKSNLAIGDEITTTGGIIGRVISVTEETVLIETSGERTKIRLLKTSVARVDVKADGTVPGENKEKEKKKKNKDKDDKDE